MAKFDLSVVNLSVKLVINSFSFLCASLAVISGTVYAPSASSHDTGREVPDNIKLFNSPCDTGFAEYCDNGTICAFKLTIDPHTVSIDRRCDFINQFYCAINVFDNAKYRLFALQDHSGRDDDKLVALVMLAGRWDNDNCIVGVYEKLNTVIKVMRSMLDEVGKDRNIGLRIHFFPYRSGIGAQSSVGRGAVESTQFCRMPSVATWCQSRPRAEVFAELLKNTIESAVTITVMQGLPGRHEGYTSFKCSPTKQDEITRLVGRTSYLMINCNNSHTRDVMCKILDDAMVDRVLLSGCSEYKEDPVANTVTHIPYYDMHYNAKTAGVALAAFIEQAKKDERQSVMPLRGDRATFHNGVRVADNPATRRLIPITIDDAQREDAIAELMGLSRTQRMIEAPNLSGMDV